VLLDLFVEPCDTYRTLLALLQAGFFTLRPGGFTVAMRMGDGKIMIGRIMIGKIMATESC
jgi:hypothetical protein